MSLLALQSSLPKVQAPAVLTDPDDLVMFCGILTGHGWSDSRVALHAGRQSWHQGLLSPLASSKEFPLLR